MEGVHRITPHLARLAVSTTVASLDAPDAPWLQEQPFQAIGRGPVANDYGYRSGLPERIRTLAVEHGLVIIEGIWQYHAYATAVLCAAAAFSILSFPMASLISGSSGPTHSNTSRSGPTGSGPTTGFEAC